MTPHDQILLCMVIGLVAALIMAADLVGRPLPSRIESDSVGDIMSGRLIVVLGLAAVVGASAYGSSLGILGPLVDETATGSVIFARAGRFLLTYTFCWYTFNGRVWAYWLIVFNIGLGIIASLPMALSILSGEDPGLVLLFPLLFLLMHWSLGIAAIAFLPDGRRFIRCQQDEHRSSTRRVFQRRGSQETPILTDNDRNRPWIEQLGELARSREARIALLVPISLIVGFMVSPRSSSYRFEENFYTGLGEVGVDAEEFDDLWADSSDVAYQLRGAQAIQLYLSDQELVEVLSLRLETLEAFVENGLYEACDVSNVGPDTELEDEALSLLRTNVNRRSGVLTGRALGRASLGVEPRPINELDSVSAEEWLDLFEESVEGDDQATELLYKVIDAPEELSNREKCEWNVMVHAIYLENASESLGSVTVLDVYRWEQLASIASINPVIQPER